MNLLGVLSTVLINEYAVLCFQQFVLGARIVVCQFVS